MKSYRWAAHYTRQMVISALRPVEWTTGIPAGQMSSVEINREITLIVGDINRPFELKNAMKLNIPIRLNSQLILAFFAVSMLPSMLSAQAQGPLVLGLDHIPVVVRDLDKAQADYRAMGFAIKAGRIHSDGIRNAHVKFPDGTEIELITAMDATDELTSEYRAKMHKGEGPVYFGLYAPDLEAVAKRFRQFHIVAQQENGMLTFASDSPLHPVFIGRRNQTPTDKPEHFVHPNSATRLSALWVRDSPELREVLKDLGVPLTRMSSCGIPGITHGIIATLPEGNLYLVSSKDTDILAASVEVRRLSEVENLLKAKGVQIKRDPTCGADTLWVPPANGHGIWIGFVRAGRRE